VTPAATREQPREEMSRRAFLTALGATLVGGAMAYGKGTAHASLRRVSGSTPAQTSRPNFVLIITDQERYPRHWPDGWVEANLPARQRLVQHGLSFRRHFCSATMCSPSRSTLFTGLHPAQHGVLHTLTTGGTVSPSEPTLPPSVQTMGKMLGSAGYHVVFKGKWHMSKGDDGGDPTTEQVAAYGFNDWEPTSLANDTKVENFGGGCANGDAAIAGQAATFLAAQTAEGTAEEPFLIVVGLGNPHDVLAYPNTWDQVEDDGCNNYADFDFEQGISLPANVADKLDNKPTCQLQARNVMQVALGPLATPQEMTHYANFYAGLVKEVDRHVGTVLDAIPDEIRDNTIVIYTSDHGEMGMAHGGLRQKAFQVYEETVNVPLIIHNPVLFPAAQVTDAYTASIDLMPTLATLADVPNREAYTFWGTDLTPLLAEPQTPVQHEILFTFDDIWGANPNGPILHPITGEEVPGAPKNIRAIFTQDDDGEWKYARYFDPNGVEPEQFELYHLRNGQGEPVDPFELDNLAHPASSLYNDPTIVAKREQLAQRLAAFEAERLQPLSWEHRLPMIYK
jgi:choline-sulfatase